MTTEIDAEMRLATYGTLAPGRANEDQLSMLTGEWSEGWVFGRLLEEGWGAEHGCPGIVLDPDGSRVDVHIFTSCDLPDHWARLDAFEGEGYRRARVTVHSNSGELEADIYELASADGR